MKTHPVISCPFAIRCTACLALILPFPVVAVGMVFGANVPWISFVCIIFLADRALISLVGTRAGNGWNYAMLLKAIFEQFRENNATKILGERTERLVAEMDSRSLQ